MNMFAGLTGVPRSTPQRLWRNRWPLHCRACDGWGGRTFLQSHGPGPSEQLFDICGATEDIAMCHRCGVTGLDEDGNGPCTACGWNYDDGVWASEVFIDE